MKNLEICFGYTTALQILRTIDQRELARARRRTVGLPACAPSRDELDEALLLLGSSYPGLEIERPVHVVTGTASRCRLSQDYRLHTCLANLSNRSLYQLDNGICLSSPALAIVQAATQEESSISLLELEYELCGSYQSKRTGVASAYQVKPLMSASALRDYVTRNSSLYGTKRVAKTMRYLADGSASPRETKLALILGLPMVYGGYGFGIPQMNFEIAANGAARRISRKASFRSDLCWPEAKLDVEYQSREMHGGEASRIQDSRRTNALLTMGWNVVSVTNDELDSLAAIDAIAVTLARRLGKRMQVRVSDYHARKLKLRRQLGLPVGYE